MKGDRVRELDTVFYPRSIAVVGASRKEGTMSSYWVKNLVGVGFNGRVYPVNPGGGEILGMKAYPDLASIPEPVDYVIVSTAPDSVLPSLDACVAKGVGAVHIFTAGFKETGTEMGRLLEDQMVAKARKGGFRIIGPNCIGVYCHSNRMPLYNASPLGKAGSIAFVSQSGGHAERLFDTGRQRGLRFSKIISLGNSCDVDAVEVMEYFAADPEVEIIAAYLEGVGDGRSLLEIIRQAAKTKPVIVWKGGGSGAGAKAVSSHTGSLAGSGAVWAAALTQAGAIRVESLEELADTLLGFQNLPPFSGRRVAIVAVTAGSGGVSVSSADSCSALGLEIVSLSEGTKTRLRSFVSSVGHILENPLDVAYASTQKGDLSRILRLVAADTAADVVLVYENLQSGLRYFGRPAVQAANDLFVEFSRDGGKPFVLVSQPTLTGPGVSAIEAGTVRAGLAVYPSVERAGRAIVNVTEYWRKRERTLV